MERDIRFREVQSFRQPWLWLILVIAAALGPGIFLYGVIQQVVLGKPWGNHPTSNTTLLLIEGVELAISIGVLVLFFQMRLITEVRPDGLYIRFAPLQWAFVRFPFARIRRAEAVTYNPLRDYGGWGLRLGRAGRAYNVSGRRGVQLELTDGARVLIGSQRPEELAQAIESAHSSGPIRA